MHATSLKSIIVGEGKKRGKSIRKNFKMLKQKQHIRQSESMNDQEMGIT